MLANAEPRFLGPKTLWSALHGGPESWLQRVSFAGFALPVCGMYLAGPFLLFLDE
jgi:hypothetical protein